MDRGAKREYSEMTAPSLSQISLDNRQQEDEMTEPEDMKRVEIHRRICDAIEKQGCISNIEQFIFWDANGRAIFKFKGENVWREIDVRETQ